jgi:uncharacterized protein (TIGR00730 family)
MMASLSDACVALPGGAGTLDEFFEAWTWTQPAIHRKPVGLLNVAGYFDPLLRFLQSAVDERFIRREHADAVVVDADAGRLIDRLAAHGASEATSGSTGRTRRGHDRRPRTSLPRCRCL